MYTLCFCCVHMFILMVLLASSSVEPRLASLRLARSDVRWARTSPARGGESSRVASRIASPSLVRLHRRTFVTALHLCMSTLALFVNPPLPRHADRYFIFLTPDAGCRGAAALLSRLVSSV